MLSLFSDTDDGAARDPLTVQARTGIDAQGRPTYAAARTTEAVVLAYDAAGAASGGADRYAIDSKGSRTHYHATAYFDDEDDAPGESDRVTWDGRDYFVAERKVVKAIDGTLHHIRVRLKLAAATGVLP